MACFFEINLTGIIQNIYFCVRLLSFGIVIILYTYAVAHHHDEFICSAL